MPKPLSRDCLSAKDQAVLDSVFDPLQIGGSDVPNIFDPEISQCLDDLPEEDNVQNVESKNFELEGVKIAENGDLDRALKLFENAIESAPLRPSPYNNRAQVYRLKGNDDAAFSDLHKAISLSTQSGRTKCQAFCQRGVLHRKRENLEAARRDFEEAAKLGSKFAKTQLVEINPYAALCNQMLRDAFEKLS